MKKPASAKHFLISSDLSHLLKENLAAFGALKTNGMLLCICLKEERPQGEKPN